jgi:hypothetical protein
VYGITTADYVIQANLGLSLEATSEIYNAIAYKIKVCDIHSMGSQVDEQSQSLLTPETGLGSGVCFSRFIGASIAGASPAGQNICDSLPGWSCSSSSRMTINGFQ